MKLLSFLLYLIRYFTRGVYSAQDSFFPRLQIFIFFSPPSFFSLSTEENGKIFKELYILFILSLLPHIFLVFFTKEEGEMKKIFSVFLIFAFLPLQPLIFFSFTPTHPALSRDNFENIHPCNGSIWFIFFEFFPHLERGSHAKYKLYKRKLDIAFKNK